MCYLIAMAARSLHLSRLMTLIVFLGLIATGCTSTAEGAEPTSAIRTTLADSPTTSSEVDSTSEASSSSSATKATTTTTASLSLDAPIPEGSAVIIPKGPYMSDQRVALLVRDHVTIDLYNRAPRLCARVNGGEEVCDPSRLQAQVLRGAPAGTQGVTIELPQRYFGPKGEDDCGQATVECRLLWVDETGRALASPNLTFSRTLEPSPLILEATLGPEIGVANIRLQDLGSLDLTEFLTPQKLEEIENSVNFSGHFDRERLELTIAIGALCGFGVGGPPIGSEGLLESPSWWPTTTPYPLSYPVNCDWLAVEGELDSGGADWSSFRVQRDIYGFGGWQDCAIEVCYLEAVVSWRHPLPDGSKLGDEITASRVLIDIPDSWPSTRPSISILEPGPYKPGQEVTVEVRNYPYGASGLDISWCPNDEYTCYYQSATNTTIGDIYRVTLTIPRSADECGLNQCYFAIDSRSEGMAPSGIVVVPMTN